MVNLKKISTEQHNNNTEHIDSFSTYEILKTINDEDQKVASIVATQLEKIEHAVDAIYNSFKGGGRLVYCGCGTSGRLGILDAVECVPTFGVSPDMVVGIIGGGEGAFVKAVEGAEDDAELGRNDLKKINFSSDDVLVGIAASGRTPYVLGAMNYAKQCNASVVAVCCSSSSEMEQVADIAIVPVVGPEVITGSTRLKCGTAQKLVLNMLSTASMIKIGKVYGNLMVDVKATNEKLVNRCIDIVCKATSKTREEAVAALEQCEYSAKCAIVMLILNITAQNAKEIIDKSNGNLRSALEV